MYTAVYSAKAGVGVSSTTALLALAASARAEPTLLVDLDGDQPAVLGLDEPSGPGIVEWTTTPGRSDEALDRISIEGGPDLHLAPRGSGSLPERATELCDALDRRATHVFVDAGVPDGAFRAEVLRRASRRIAVVRYCYLSLRAAAADEHQPTDAIVVVERDRALGLGDVESVIDCPVVATIAVDSSVASAIDAGLLRSRPPRRLLRALARVVAGVG